ncbi:hypothetical protein niasHT_027318 [Heterodera trifolii]|uniref:LITAF domain-containing protein n=1 Tax=Heterodera trifolii TaxID=157864 RepID=A0ABD2JTM7_9BILA
MFGPYPVDMDCPYCGQRIVTAVQKRAGGKAWGIAAVLFFTFVCFYLAWLPFCLDSCLDSYHFCPSCRQLLGRFTHC